MLSSALQYYEWEGIFDAGSPVWESTENDTENCINLYNQESNKSYLDRWYY